MERYVEVSPRRTLQSAKDLIQRTRRVINIAVVADKLDLPSTQRALEKDQNYFLLRR